MNRLYVELLKDNADWGTAARRHDMNHFMARLIFCFFAERTDIFQGIGLFTDTIARTSAKDSSDTHEVIGELFRAMNTKREDRASAGIPRWADAFPYVNGELFSGTVDTPRFSKIARSYPVLRAMAAAGATPEMIIAAVEAEQAADAAAALMRRRRDAARKRRSRASAMSHDHLVEDQQHGLRRFVQHHPHHLVATS